MDNDRNPHQVTRRTMLHAGLGIGALGALAACGSGGSGGSPSGSGSGGSASGGSASGGSGSGGSAGSGTSSASNASGAPSASGASGTSTSASADAFFKQAGPKTGAKSISVLAYDSVQGNAIKALAGEFEDLTGISVNWTALAETAAASKIAVSLGSGSGSYDIVQTTAILMPNYGSRGWLASLDDLAKKSDITCPDWHKKDYGETSTAQLSYGGVLLGAPMFVGTQVLWYRSDILEKAGLSEPPTTFDDLQGVCDKIQGGAVKPIALRTAPAVSQLMYVWTAWLYGYGGKYYKTFADGKYSDPALNSSGAVKALDLYSTLIQKYGPTGATNWSVEDVSRAFLAGRVAMCQEGLTFASTFNDPSQSQVAGKIGAAPIPAGPSGQFIPYAMHGWSIAKNSGHQDAAWLFAQWATLKSTLTKAALGKVSFATPPLTSVYKEKAYIKKYDFDHYVDTAAKTLDAANAGHVSPLSGDPNYLPAAADWATLGDSISKKLSLAVTGQASAKSAIEQAADTMSS